MEFKYVVDLEQFQKEILNKYDLSLNDFVDIIKFLKKQITIPLEDSK